MAKVETSLRDTYWEASLGASNVKFVDTEEVFLEVAELLQTATVAGLDAEWKPVLSGGNGLRKKHPARVSILQIACRSQAETGLEEYVFILDLLALQASTFACTLKAVLTSPGTLKLGYAFQDDLKHLAASFPGPDCRGCFDKVEPFIDIGHLYQYHQDLPLDQGAGGKVLIDGGLSAVAETILGQTLDKTLQCSNWEDRPLSPEQLKYAAADAHCLLSIYDACYAKAKSTAPDLGTLKSLPVVSLASSLCPGGIHSALQPGTPKTPPSSTPIMLQRGPANLVAQAAITNSTFTGPFGHLVHRLTLTSTNSRKAKPGAKKRRKKKVKPVGGASEGGVFSGTLPWEEGDGEPRFLCDVHVEGLARQLRCVGIDAASTKGPKADVRSMVEQAEAEQRVLLTSDVKLMHRRLLPKNLAYLVTTSGKQAQLREVLTAFGIDVSTRQLLSRCIKCNGEFIPHPLGPQEAAAAAPWSQVLPEAALKAYAEFWQCGVCGHIYWEGTQFERAVRQFVGICNVSETEHQDSEESSQNPSTLQRHEEVHIALLEGDKTPQTNKRDAIALQYWQGLAGGEAPTLPRDNDEA